MIGWIRESGLNSPHDIYNWELLNEFHFQAICVCFRLICAHHHRGQNVIVSNSWLWMSLPCSLSHKKLEVELLHFNPKLIAFPLVNLLTLLTCSYHSSSLSLYLMIWIVNQNPFKLHCITKKKPCKTIMSKSRITLYMHILEFGNIVCVGGPKPTSKSV